MDYYTRRRPPRIDKWAVVLRLLVMIPAIFPGMVLGALFLGLVPVVCVSIIDPSFMFSFTANIWVRGAGAVGGIVGVVFAATWAVTSAPKR